MKQNNCKIVGITGGIATGKSTVTNILLDCGYKVIDADKVARAVVEKGNKAYYDIIENFGTGVLNEDGDIDRKKLGDIIFNDKKQRHILNCIVHPRITESIQKKIDFFCCEEKVVFLDIPLLIEELDNLKKQGLSFDEIWLVYVDLNQQLERLMKRDDLNLEEAKKRVDAQMSIELKKKYATKIICNNKDKTYLKKQIKQLLNTLT